LVVVEEKLGEGDGDGGERNERGEGLTVDRRLQG
jgi:hypothetical protein